jgi:prophage tail gpP-like protein
MGRAEEFKGKPKREFKKVYPDELRASENQGAMQFAEKIVARHGFSIQSAMDRSAIVCCAPHDDEEPRFRLGRPGNILNGRARRDWSDVPTVTIARGRAGESNTELKGTRHEFPTFGINTLNPIVKIPEMRASIATDGIIREILIREQRFNSKTADTTIFGFNPPVYKPMFYQDQFSKNQEQLEYGVRKMVAERLKRTLEYTCTVRGHADDTGAIWTFDTVAQVWDFNEHVNERLWLYERDLYNDGNGPKTDMKFCRPGCYVLG